MQQVSLYEEDGSLTTDGKYAKRLVNKSVTDILSTLEKAGWDVATDEMYSLLNVAVLETMTAVHKQREAERKATREAEEKAKRAAEERKAREEAKAEIATMRDAITKQLPDMTKNQFIRVYPNVLRDYMRLVKQEEEALAEQERREKRDKEIANSIRLRNSHLWSYTPWYHNP
jgi:hypothetical protein